MDTTPHTFAELFKQLGLPNERQDIDAFLAGHRLEADQALADAPFWNEAQATFLREALDDDSDWAEEVDELAARLSH
ncbi:DUF2789 domain-containing protein [Pseudomonas citronellolis]|uniref:DUF2789 domain-containing protein n=1 Tax=Pseudomonas citronellolis TaxID=53408 RepID=UPI0023E3C1ED|nr:DUF2789 domain-containing protein [Pseudomonas citronellolis]MDF3932662.1 DUF2789 domain-containing protein [Pseudomonas citronellolis]